MSVVKRPMQRVLIIGCMAFVLVLSGALSFLSYRTFSSWYYGRYKSELAHVIRNVRDAVDIDDLQECVRTGVPSQKFNELQQFLNGYIDDFELAYLYISYPEDGNMVSVCSATSDAERAAGEEDWPLLYVEVGGYTPEALMSYEAAWNHSGISYFEDYSEWGDCYTACLPLFGSDGGRVALLCADVFIDELHEALQSYLFISTAITMGMGLLFGVLLVVWLRRNVTTPVEELEHSARMFAQKSHGHKDPELLLFDSPNIHTENEIESLALAISQMSSDMRDYVKDIVEAEKRALSAEAEAQDMSRIAYQDALTHVKSKAAYVRKREQLDANIGKFDVEFALVMVDLNDLKRINDTYGHDHGDDYIVGTCSVVCEVFSHSPVYRIGGDEFLVLLQGRDYVMRNELVVSLRNKLASASGDTNCQPWERYSAAVGMAVYNKAYDTCYDDVFTRADKTMYQQKVHMKKGMSTPR